MSNIFTKIKKSILASRGLDLEYLMNLCFVHMKYSTSESRRDALIHAKFAYCERSFSHIFEKYRNYQFENHQNEGPIWLCWLQGESSMPAVVKLCYEQLKKVIPSGKKVILITWENLREYTDIPDYIIEKVLKGYMSYIHFSDIIRFSLLANHGGLWVDSTVFVSSSIPESIFNNPYFSVTTEFDAESSYRYNGINRCLWKCFILGAAAKSTWFSCAKEVIYEYWKKNDFLLDYMLVDYILVTIHDKLPPVRRQLQGGVELAPHLYSIEKKANQPCNENSFNEIVQTCRWFKLSYKLPFNITTEDGTTTYYGKLVTY